MDFFKDEVYDDVGPGACIAINDFNHRFPDVIGGGVCVMNSSECLISLPLFVHQAAGCGVRNIKTFKSNFLKDILS